MTPTARWNIAQRRKRIVINQTLRERAQRDPRRRAPATTASTADQ
jgi:hypothetical protein